MATSFRDMAFTDPQFNFQLMRVLGFAPFGGAALGECMSAAAEMTDGDIVSWSAAWDRMAGDVMSKAESAASTGCQTTARNAYLRAANYYRAAAVWRRHDDPRHTKSWDASVKAFVEAGARRTVPMEILAIPYEGTTLPGYLFKAANDDKPRPTLIAMGGGDASGEESYFHCAGEEAARRGYNLLTFHGPGHRGALHQDPTLTWRADYEVVISAVLDHALTRGDVDSARLALYGVSLGGYVVLRAAGADDRIAAVIPNSPVVDFHGVATHPPSKNASPPSMPAPEVIAWMLDLYQWTYDGRISSRDDWLDVVKPFTAEAFVPKITCPVLAVSSEGEPEGAHAQVSVFADLVTAPTTYRMFTAAEGADAHVQFNNVGQVMDEVYDWLDAVLMTDGD